MPPPRTEVVGEPRPRASGEGRAMTAMNRRIVLASRPKQAPELGNFWLVSCSADSRAKSMQLFEDGIG